MFLQQRDRLELVTPEEHVATECEPAPAAGRLGIMRDERRVVIVGVDGHRIVVGSSEPRLDDAPAFVAMPTEKRTDGSASTSSSSTKRI